MKNIHFILFLFLFFCLTPMLASADQGEPEIVFQSATSTIMKIYTDQGGDGTVYNTHSSNWDSIRNTSDGSVNEQLILSSVNAYTNSYRKIFRGSLPVDTAPLIDSTEILNARLCVNVGLIMDRYNDDNYDWSVVVLTTISSSTKLSGSDYTKIGSLDNPIEGSAKLYTT